MINRRSLLKSSLLFTPTLPAFAVDSKKYTFEPNINYNNNDVSVNNNSTSNGANEYTNILPNNYNVDFWDLPRTISILRADTGEKASLVYFKDGKINQEHYWIASYLLRDVRQNQMMYMDIKLLNLVCAVQAWLKYYGFTEPLIVNSGYRTLKTNSSLDNAAQNSMHLYGKAIDFKLPGLSIKHIAKIANHFQAGGIGLYLNRETNKQFIHLDTGRVRHWNK